MCFVSEKKFLFFPFNFSCRIFGQWFNSLGLSQSAQLILEFGFIQHYLAISFVCMKHPNLFVEPQRFHGPQLPFNQVRHRRLGPL
jgi:hypothetical protein